MGLKLSDIAGSKAVKAAGLVAMGKDKSPSKYGNKRSTTPDGLKFDSEREKQRYYQLVMLERAGQIRELARQVAFELAPGVKIHGNARPSPPLRYVADFTYLEGGRYIVEDVKGMRTAVYVVKRHLMKHVHNIDIRET